MSACEIREPIRHVTRPEQIATLRYYRRLRPGSRDPPIRVVWLLSSELLKGAPSRVICTAARVLALRSGSLHI
jgi:hypothetical protein